MARDGSANMIAAIRRKGLKVLCSPPWLNGHAGLEIERERNAKAPPGAEMRVSFILPRK
jgi:hypothetical protein